MKLTILKNDNLIGIDGVFLPVDCSSLEEGLRVVQFDNESGHEEWIDLPNLQIESITPYQSLIDAWQLAKSEADAAAADPFYGMTLGQKRDAMESLIISEEDRRNLLPIEHPNGSGKFHKTTETIKRIVDRYASLADGEPFPHNGGCWDDADGNPILMTMGGLRQLWNAIIDRGTYNYGVRKYHISEMLKLTDPTIYDFSGGWQ